MSSFEGTGTILGGLPVYAYINAWRDDWTGEYDSEVESIHWLKRNGRPGKQIPDKVWDRAEKYDDGFCNLIDSISEQLAFEAYERKREERREEALLQLRKHPTRKLSLV